MKISKIALFAAGAVALAACSSDAPDVNGNGQQPAAGYVQIDIKLPTVSGSRGVASSFEEGLAQEYAVSNGKIVVFKKGADEGAATAVCTAPLSGMSWGAGQSGEITTSSSSVAQLSNISMGDDTKYCALVVLNYNDNFEFPATGETFQAWSQRAQENAMILSADGKEYLTMSNAAKYAQGSQPTVLVDLDKTKIAQTESTISASAATVHVQRATAKVTVNTEDSYALKGESYKNDKVTLTGWALDITNKSGYPVQVTEGLATPYVGIWTADRFSGGTKFPRFFWAKDPNYSISIDNLTQVAAHFNVIGESQLNSAPAAAYCLENTFDINNMKQGQTTRVVFKGTYVPSGLTQGESFIKIGGNTTLWSIDGARAQILAKAKTALNSTDVTVELGSTVKKAGYHKLKDVSIKLSGSAITDAQYDAVAAALGLKDASETGIATYENGEVYYVSRIKHFGDEDCPWKIGDITYGDNNETNCAKYLGRYGMVRNFWYEVNVRSITALGEPAVPEIKPEVPDDENDYYIQTQINILAWAKRVLNIEL